MTPIARESGTPHACENSHCNTIPSLQTWLKGWRISGFPARDGYRANPAVLRPLIVMRESWLSGPAPGFRLRVLLFIGTVR
jgi:hypothetical protein